MKAEKLGPMYMPSPTHSLYVPSPTASTDGEEGKTQRGLVTSLGPHSACPGSGMNSDHITRGQVLSYTLNLAES